MSSIREAMRAEVGDRAMFFLDAEYAERIAPARRRAARLHDAEERKKEIDNSAFFEKTIPAAHRIGVA